MLENHSILKEVLRLEDARDENDAFTIHLICRNSIQTNVTPPNPTVSTVKTSTESNLRRRNVEQSSISPPLPATATFQSKFIQFYMISFMFFIFFCPSNPPLPLSITHLKVISFFLT